MTLRSMLLSYCSWIELRVQCYYCSVTLSRDPLRGHAIWRPMTTSPLYRALSMAARCRHGLCSFVLPVRISISGEYAPDSKTKYYRWQKKKKKLFIKILLASFQFFFKIIHAVSIVRNRTIETNSSFRQIHIIISFALYSVSKQFHPKHTIW